MASLNGFVNSLFGFEFVRRKKEDEIPSFASKETDDGASVVTAGGGIGTFVDIDGTVRTEAELITKYREMHLVPECDAAVDEITNEALSIDEEDIVELNLDNLDLSENLKKIVYEEFKHCLELLDFKKNAYSIFTKWYVDGRLYYHVLVDKKNIREGIKELRYVDPRKMRKIREVAKRKNTTMFDETALGKVVNEYYLFSDKGFNYGSRAYGSQTTGLRVAKDSVIYVTSGLTDNQGKLVLSWMHKAIKPLNMLRNLEDAVVIYRLARAPERRIWYIDVGNLPKVKAEQYIRDIMTKWKNRLVYDASSGEIRDDRKFMTMLDDYWLPRREGGRGTQVETLPGGQTLGQMDDVLYFQKKFLQSLNVPVSRINTDSSYSIGRATEITRDELKFSRFVVRLRSKFSMLFTEILKKQLVLKGIFSLEDFEKIEQQLEYNYAKDNYFTELKDAEIAKNRLDLANEFGVVTSKYYSNRWVRKNILKQTDEDIQNMDKEIKQEEKSGELRWVNPTLVGVQQEIENKDLMNQQASAELEAGPEEKTATKKPAAKKSPAKKAPAKKSTDSSAQKDDSIKDKAEKVRRAKIIVKQMKDKGAGNRSSTDDKKYKSAVQVLSKNKDVSKKTGLGLS